MCKNKTIITMKKMAVFASGTGSNAVNLVKYFSGRKTGEVALLISNNPDAPVLEKMKVLGIPAQVATKEEFESPSYMLPLLEKHGVSFIVLAGFLKLIPPYLIKAFENRIVNIHPALLPKYGGKGMYGARVHEAVVAAGEKESGITIHYVNEHYDEGATIFQATCPVEKGDSPDDVARKVHELEYAHFPEVVEKVLMAIQD